MRQNINTPKPNIWYKYNDMGSETVTIFIHGLGGNSLPFKKFTDTLAANGHSTLIFDLKSHGYSLKPSKSSYKPTDYSQDIIEILKKEKIHKINLVGHCFGGMIAMELQHWVKGSIYINKQILISTSHVPNLSYRNTLIRLNLPLLKFILQILYGKYYLHKIKRQSDYSNYKINRDFSFNRFSEDARNTSVDTIVLTLQEIIKSNFSNKLDKSLPTLIVHGKKDTIYSYKSALELNKMLENSRLLLRNNDNHVSHIISKETDLPIIVKDFLLEI